MKRFAFASSALLVLALAAPSAFAQGKPAQAPAVKATPTAGQAPAAPARFVKTVKGIATIELIRTPSKKIGGEMVTLLKIRNTSPLAISLLKVDEYWYDKKNKVVTGDTQAHRKPFLAGEIIEITMKAPLKPDLYASNYMFSHAGGEIKLKTVKKFE